METKELNKWQGTLDLLINQAIINSITSVSPIRKLQEPDYVSLLSTNFTERLFHILDALFPHYNFAVSGVYCHQKPIVDINVGKKPELGDVLFVYFYDNLDGVTLCNSLLLQAKVTKSTHYAIPHSEKHQLELYMHWPEFTYYRGPLNGINRNIVPKTINDGAQYLLIDNDINTNGALNSNNCFPMGCAIPANELQLNRSFSSELIDFLKFKSGRTFDKDEQNTEDDWSKMIWDLLHISVINSRRSNIGMNKFPRQNTFISGNSPMFNMLLEQTKNGLSYQKPYSNKDSDSNVWHDNDDNVGISTIIIESNRRRKD